MSQRMTVVVSRGQSNHPVKRALEEGIVSALLTELAVDVVVVENLYDLRPDGEAITRLRNIEGDFIVISWHYERAAHWTLDRYDVRGQLGETRIKAEEDEEDEADLRNEAGDEAGQRVIELREVPQRNIYCLNLALRDSPQAFVDEVKRIATDCNGHAPELMSWIAGAPTAEQWQRYLRPQGATPAPDNGDGQAIPTDKPATSPAETRDVTRIEDSSVRRWYPVIDFSRCTNCMECIDFCLFGVYGVDQAETILVEQPDNCRKGCPACSRVCPENAIIFPQHKTPVIAGAPAAGSGLKIDLSQLFGAADAVEVAARERDEQLILAGREAVGTTSGIPKRQTDNEQPGPKDDLDSLIDQLDELDL